MPGSRPRRTSTSRRTSARSSGSGCRDAAGTRGSAAGAVAASDADADARAGSCVRAVEHAGAERDAASHAASDADAGTRADAGAAQGIGRLDGLRRGSVGNRARGYDGWRLVAASPRSDPAQLRPPDVSSVRSHQGGATSQAASALGAEAFASATGRVLGGLDLHRGTRGRARGAAAPLRPAQGQHRRRRGDPYERHADAVA
jgi:hypothetical protein